MATPAAAVPARSLVLRHMPSLDSIRGLAVLMVLMFHGFGSFPWQGLLGPRGGALMKSFISCGRFGVSIFFVLSGFLITGLLMKARQRQDFYQNFYIRRVLRILPVYLVTLIVLRLWHVVDFRFILAALLFLANFARLFGVPSAEYGPLWSLAVEEHFYLLWPTCVRRLQERTLLRLLLLVIVAEPLLRLAGAYISSHIDIHYKTPFVLDFIAYGAMLSLLIRRGSIHLGNARRIGVALLGISGVLALGVIAFSAFHEEPALEALADLPFTWGTCGLILVGLVQDHTRFEKTGRTSARGILPFYGYISYGLYLVNVLVFIKVGGAASRLLPASTAARPGVYAAVALLCIALSTGVAYLSRRFFEAPMLSLKDKWQDRFAQPTAPPPAPVNASAG